VNVSEDNVGELDDSGYDFICGLKKNKEVKAAFKKRNRGEKIKRAEEELSAYSAKLAGGNYREMEKVVSKVKAILKGGVSPYFKCTYSKEGDRITFDFKRRFAVSNSRLGSDRYGIGWMEGLKPIYLYAISHIY